MNPKTISELIKFLDTNNLREYFIDVYGESPEEFLFFDNEEIDIIDIDNSNRGYDGKVIKAIFEDTIEYCKRNNHQII